MSKHWEQNKDATVYVGNIDERFSQELLSELMTQVGPVRQVHMPQDRVSQTHQGYGFVEFDTAESADYASKVLNGIRVWGKPIRVNKASADKQKAVDIGAELFINNLDPQVDEKILYDTFSQFGQILRQPNIIRDDNNISKGYGFVSFDSFEASDVARDNMNGQYLLSKQITVEYAYKKDGKGERHGDDAERKLAAEGKKHNIVPEQQTLPPAFHMSAPAATSAAAPGLLPDPAGLTGAPPMGGMPPIPPAMSPAGFNAPAGFAPPTGPAFPGHGGPAGFNPAPAYGNVPPPPFPGMPPQMPVGIRPGGGMPTPGFSLPPAPSGLPARPPPSHAGFGGPADFHPGSFRAPPPVAGPGGSPVYPGVPPPVGGVPPTGFSPVNGGPVPGFAPPPGFGPPGRGAPGPGQNGYPPHR